jgi:soluble lytic murein transglycosylase-like protein
LQGDVTTRADVQRAVGRGIVGAPHSKEFHVSPLRLSICAALAALLVPSAASAHVVHAVAPGETLWSIAAQSNLTTRTVAVYNGLSPDAHVVLGSTLKVPSIAEGAAALARSAAPAVVQAGVAAAPAGTPRPQGAYVVRAGDTLSALAAQTGVSVRMMAFMNGLDPAKLLLTGTVLKLPNGAAAPAGASRPAPATRVIPRAAPLPTPGHVSAERVKQLAVEHGAPGSLAAAIAWQESGFNNAVVSGANARGVMQIMPGTWDWVQSNLASGPLSPTSAEDNVRAGSLYLARLLREAGGDPRLAAAGYYQGLHSVRTRGMFDDTKRYVDNVLALRARFGG